MGRQLRSRRGGPRRLYGGCSLTTAGQDRPPRAESAKARSAQPSTPANVDGPRSHRTLPRVDELTQHAERLLDRYHRRTGGLQLIRVDAVGSAGCATEVLARRDGLRNRDAGPAATFRRPWRRHRRSPSRRPPAYYPPVTPQGGAPGAASRHSGASIRSPPLADASGVPLEQRRPGICGWTMAPRRFVDKRRADKPRGRRSRGDHAPTSTSATRSRRLGENPGSDPDFV